MWILKYSTEAKNLEMLKNFRNNLYSIAPLQEYASKSYICQKTGSLVDALLYVNPTTQEIVSLEKAKKLKSIDKENKLKKVFSISDNFLLKNIYKKNLGCLNIFLPTS